MVREVKMDPDVQWEIRGGSLLHLWCGGEHLLFNLSTACHVETGEHGTYLHVANMPGSPFGGSYPEAYLKALLSVPTNEQIARQQAMMQAQAGQRIVVPGP
jgi:hypothetical protein